MKSTGQSESHRIYKLKVWFMYHIPCVKVLIESCLEADMLKLNTFSNY